LLALVVERASGLSFADFLRERIFEPLGMSGSVAGQLFVCLLSRTSTGTHTYPAGWTELTEQINLGDDVTSIAYRPADGTETGTFTVTISTGTQKFAAIVWRISGACDPAIQAPQLSAPARSASTTPNPTTVTPTGGAKDYLFLWLGAWSGEQPPPPTSQPTNYASATPDRQGASTGTGGLPATNCRVAGTTRKVNAASEDPGSWTISASGDWIAWAMAVHPPPPPGGELAAPIFQVRKGYF